MNLKECIAKSNAFKNSNKELIVDEESVNWDNEQFAGELMDELMSLINEQTKRWAAVNDSRTFQRTNIDEANKDLYSAMAGAYVGEIASQVKEVQQKISDLTNIRYDLVRLVAARNMKDVYGGRLEKPTEEEINKAAESCSISVIIRREDICDEPGGED